MASKPWKASRRNSSRSSFSSSLGRNDASLELVVEAREGDDGADDDDDDEAATDDNSTCPSRAWAMAADELGNMPA